MKERRYDFTAKPLRGPLRTKREIIDSLKQFARETKNINFTQRQYDRWPGRALCSRHIAHRFGSWANAMQEAGLSASWGIRKDLKEMVELFMDCWEEHSDAPTVRVLEDFMKRNGCAYNGNMYSRYFGGVNILAKRIVDFHLGKISESQLLERVKRARGQRRPISAALRKFVLVRDGYQCVRCRSRGPLDVHHKIPVSQGGSNDPTNLETLCEPCHEGEHTSRRLLPRIRFPKDRLIVQQEHSSDLEDHPR
jgi:hypothetical protein